MARTATSSTKDKLNKGQIAKIAEDSAKKAVKKTATRIAKQEATKVAAKVATEAVLNPDYELNDDEELLTVGSSSWESDEDEDEDEEWEDKADYSPRLSFASALKGNSYADDEDDEEEEEETGADLSKDVKNRDIFAYANDLMNKGTPVRLQIKKNGQFLTTVKKPYSEEQLQKDHGEGHYNVILRNDIKGTFIKQQSFSIAAPPTPAIEAIKYQVEKQEAKQEEKLDKMFQTFSQMQAAQTESQNTIFERLLEEQRRREEEEKERRREERENMKYNEQSNNSVLASVLQAALQPRETDNSSTTAILQLMQSQQSQTAQMLAAAIQSKDSDSGMSSVLQLMQNQQNQTNQMIMESNKNFMLMIQEMRKDTQSMMEKITQSQAEQSREFRTQIAEMTNKKTDAFDPVTMFKMLNDTREAGMNFGLKINDLAKQIAESDIQPTQPKGIVESVLDNLGKFAPLMLAANQQPSASSANYFHNQSPAVQAIPQAPTQAPVRKAAPAAPVKQAVKATTQSVQPKVVKASVVTAPANSKTLTKTVPASVASKTVVASNSKGGKIEADSEVKAKVINICVPLIGHALQNGITSGGLGDASINAFASQGIEPKKAIELVSVEDIYDLAFKSYSLPDVPELRNYLKDYHDYLRQKTSLGESGQVA